MADYQDDTTASNYSIQPGSNHPPIPDPIDVRDHPARSMPDMNWGTPLSLEAPGNSMLRDRSLGPANVKVNKANGYPTH